MNPLVNYIIVYTHAFMYTCRFKYTRIFSCRADNVDKDQQPTLAEQLKLELSQKNMIFSKKSLHLSKIVGQGQWSRNVLGIGGGKGRVSVRLSLKQDTPTMALFTPS